MLPTSKPQRHLEARLTQLIRVCSVQQRPSYDHATNAEGGNRLSLGAALRSLPGQAALQWRDRLGVQHLRLDVGGGEVHADSFRAVFPVRVGKEAVHYLGVEVLLLAK